MVMMSLVSDGGVGGRDLNEIGDSVMCCVCVCESGVLTRREILTAYAAYAEHIEVTRGPKSRSHLLRPLQNLFHAESNGKAFRRQLDACAKGERGGWEGLSIGDAILKCGEIVPEDVLDKC